MLLRAAPVVAWLAAAATAAGSGLPVTSARPRVLVDPARRAALAAKASGNDPSWLALKQRADVLATYSVFPYVYSNRTAEPDNSIFYDYQGEGWFAAAMPLGLAYLAAGNAAHQAKLVALADEMIRAQGDPQNNPPNGLSPLEPDDYYPTRYLPQVLAAVYDWCYDSLGPARRAQMVALMNAWYDDLKANAYQRNDHPDGNYFWSHAAAAAWMGYASSGDNPRAQEMIDYARIRFDGTPSPLLGSEALPLATVVQAFDGGAVPTITMDGGPALPGAPWGGGLTVQGWAYTSGTWSRLIDYMLLVRTATGEDLAAAHPTWLPAILRSEKHALAPNRFEIDPVGDWGGDYGPAVHQALPLRLSAMLAGTPDGPAAQHFYASELASSSPYGDADFPDSIYQSVYKPAAWERFLYEDSARPSAELTLPPYFSPFASGVAGAQPYFVMRSDWSSAAVWSSASLGGAWWDDHQHFDAGSMAVRRGDDFLLVDAGSWMGPAGGHGLVGGSTEENTAAAANTLFFHDWGDFQRITELQYLGGQGAWGQDEVAAAEQNDLYTYVRGDLSSAYDNGSDPASQSGRRLEAFRRSFVYLRAAGVFVVYDQVRVKPSSNPHGPYLKHLRWHFPARPTVSGNRAVVSHGASRLDLDTLSPAGALLAVVDESANPDRALIPCDNPCDSGTFRLEVRDPADALAIDFLTAFRPAAAGAPAMATALLAAEGGSMLGAEIRQASRTDVVYFNAGSGAAPPPIAEATLRLSSAPGAAYTLFGMQPGGRYRVVPAGGSATVTQDAAGDLAASAAGVLQFTTGAGGPARALAPARRRGTPRPVSPR